jgi:hypothetical protein
MVMLRIEMVPQDNYDLSNNSGYATVELTSIYNDPNTWPHKVILPSQLTRGQAFLSRKQDVDPGTYPVFVGMKLTNYALVYMNFDINIYDDATNKRLFNATFTMPTYQNVKTQAVGQLTVTPSGGGGTAPGTVNITIIITSGGSVTVWLPDGTKETKTPGTYTYTVQSDAWLTFDASPDTGYYFQGYYDHEDGSLIASSTRLYLSSSYDRTIEARFAASTTPPPGYYVLTYNVGPNGTLYIGNDAYRNTSGQKMYTAGAQVDIMVEPDQGYEIDRITIDGSPLPTATPFTYTITMSGNVTVDVSFKKAETPQTTDIGEIIRQMMNSVLPPMMSMMGMMMTMSIIMSIMTGMMQSLAGAIAA